MSQLSVKKIAIINPYLQRGITQSAEAEFCELFKIATQALNIQTEIFAQSEAVYDFDPDFVVVISYQEPKLTRYPTYGLLVGPTHLIEQSPRFTRNLFSYDGYFVTSVMEKAWIQSVCQRMGKKLYAADTNFSVPQTAFQNIFAMHAEVMQETFFQTSETMLEAEKVTYLVAVDDCDNLNNILDDIAKQTYRNVDVMLLCQDMDAVLHKVNQPLAKNVFAIKYQGANDNSKIVDHLNQANTRWFGIMKSSDRLFPNHTALLMQEYQQSTHNKSNEGTVVVFANSLEHTKTTLLTDRIQDDCMLYTTSKTRVCNITPVEEIPMCGVLIRLNSVTIQVFQSIILNRNIIIELDISSDPRNIALQCHSVTCSSNIDAANTPVMVNDKLNLALLKILNAHSPLRIPSNFHVAQGKLLVEA